MKAPRVMCPCCGHLTLIEGPGDYDLCPVCFWEDDPTQLRWPLSDDGANGISLIEAQSAFQTSQAIHASFTNKVRPPHPDERRAEDWRPIDLSVDLVEGGPGASDEARPWPAVYERLYWWRADYHLRDSVNAAIILTPEQERDEQLIDIVVAQIPEAAAVRDQMRELAELPAPFQFADGLSLLALEDIDSGDPNLAARIAEQLDPWMTLEAGRLVNVVVIGFLENERWHAHDITALTEDWPSRIRKELRRQHRYVVRAGKAEAKRWRRISNDLPPGSHFTG